ncbi:MAG: sigma-70 family RNA polymerase sigma factor [Candidatus Hydrogenedens sp.]|jgi:RNA polymerase sigma-70 factor (ECF subfamily)|nr:sigma-70 family RNA polymerase sigma factor [Candidatus Hydrogenedens sp.]
MTETANKTAIEDLELTAKARQGDTGAFEDLVRRYRNEVYALCFYFTRNREDAWDLSQEVFIKAWRALSRFRGDSSFKTWLMRIAANHSKDHLKKRRLQVTAYDDALQVPETRSHQNPRGQAEANEIGRAIEAAVGQLPPKLQLAFILREYQGLSYQEMAEVMECNVGTVMSRLFNARRRLQKILAPLGLLEGYTHD